MNTFSFPQGERPYNDDSLLSDSITLEDEQLLDEIECVSAPELNLTQIGQQVCDSNSTSGSTSSVTKKSPEHIAFAATLSSSNSTLNQRSGIPSKPGSRTKKTLPAPKKRSSAMKY